MLFGYGKSFAARAGLVGQGSLTQTINLPLSTSIAHFKYLCGAIFKIDSNVHQLVLKGSLDREDEDIGANSTLDLAHYNIWDGATVHVLALDENVVWSRFAGTTVEVVPSTWLLPPELRPELVGLSY